MTAEELKTDIEARWTVVRKTRGVYEYRCKVADDSPPFDEIRLEVERGGCLIIHAVPLDDRIAVYIVAKRLWATSQQHTGKREPHSDPVSWTAEGGIPYSGEHLEFKYSTSDANAGGKTTDAFRLEPELVHLDSGVFHHLRADKVKVNGEVWLRPLAPPYDLEWAPVRAMLEIANLTSAMGEHIIAGLPDEVQKLRPLLIDAITGTYESVGQADLENTVNRMNAEMPDALLFLAEPDR